VEWVSGDMQEEWPPYLNAYSMELRFQLSAAKSALDSLEAFLARRKDLGKEFNRAQREDYVPPPEAERRAFLVRHLLPIANLSGPILGEIQGFLAAVGVVTSVLWPTAKKSRGESDRSLETRLARGAEIRRLLEVDEHSPLRSRTGREDDVRGGFLHFDEMIDEFHRVHPGEVFVSFDIGSAASGTASNRELAVRWLDEDTLELWVNGRSANLREIWKELVRVLGRIQIIPSVSLKMGPRRTDGPPAPGVAFGAPGWTSAAE